MEQLFCIARYYPFKDIRSFVIQLDELDQAEILSANTGVLIHYNGGRSYRSIFPLKATKANSIRKLNMMETQKYFGNIPKSRDRQILEEGHQSMGPDFGESGSKSIMCQCISVVM